MLFPGLGPAAGSTSGLVAAYSFDDGSGSVLTDASGNGHDGTISGATWTGGHDGGALSFNGTNASVDLGSLGTFYQSGFTLEAWVQKATTKNDVGVLGSWTRSGGPMLWIDHLAGHYQLTLGATASPSTSTPATLPLGPVAAPRRHLRRQHRPLLHRRRPGREPQRLVQRRHPNIWRIGAYGTVPAASSTA